ncbi:UDP-N-acetylmuramoyl-L-alanine--D-glutamate ligase [Candidatus Microgenomates bacterium]|nr:UDP-N-acetylmuramoyl-L-alanine--D-glutamate ligase [Candidatus Microgenomates bacterium]
MNLKGKKAAVLGFSIEGMATTRYLLKAGARVIVCDQNSPQKLEENLKKIKADEVLLQLGKNCLKNLNQFEILFRTPGMPLWHPELITAKKAGVQISSQTKLFFDLCPCPIIGVTGTKGKGTTASLIFEILKTAGKNVFLGGNIGNPPIEFLDKLTSDSWVILELSSFQLEDLEASPHIAVVLNITSDHLFSVAPDNPNYHLSQKDYLKAKENIVKYQKKKDYAVLNFDYQVSRNFSQLTQGQIHYFSKKKKIKGAYVQSNSLFLNKDLIGETQNLILPGIHNWENVTAAICAASLAGAPISAIKKAVFDFKGLEHRLEFVREVEGVKYYNDSFSTTPETAIAAIKAFKKPIILIAGGSEKGLDYTELGKEIVNSSVKTLILIGQIADKIEKAVRKNSKTPKLKNSKLKIIKNLKTMKEIIKEARIEANPGDIIVLSPASASFDMFKNYKERGKQFKNEAAKI